MEASLNVYSSSEAVSLTRAVVLDRAEAKDNEKLSYGTPDLDKYLIPPWSGDLEIVCGRPQNFKTGYMQIRLHDAVNRIMTRRAYNQCAILVTWEVSVEQATAYWLAIESGVSATDMMRGEVKPENVKTWEAFNTAIKKVGARPLYIIGHSIQRSSGQRKRPNLTPQNVEMAIDYIVNTLKKDPVLIVMDYLQRIHQDDTKLTAERHFTACVDWAKNMALHAGCSIVLGSQAGRQVDEYQIKLPRLRDSQWSSNAEQSADKFISLWMPKQSHAEGDWIEFGDVNVQVSDRLLLLSVAKQKFGAAGKVFPLYVEPEFLKIGDLQKRSINL